MALTDQTTHVTYEHDGVTVDYNIPFMSYDTSPVYGDIKVYSIDSSGVSTELSEGTDFTFQTIAGGRVLPTGIILPDTIRLNSAGVVPTLNDIKIQRDTEVTQNNTLADKTIETSLDKITARLQEVAENTGSSTNLQMQIDENAAAIKVNADDIADNASDISIVATVANTNHDDIADLTADKAEQSDLVALESIVTDNTSAIADNASLASDAMAKANNNETAIADLNLDKAQIGYNKDDIAALDLRVTANETNITDNTTKITEHEGRITNLEDNLLSAVINGTMDIVNNVTVPADVTYEWPVGSTSRVPLQFDADEVASVEIKFSIARSTDDNDQPASGTLYMVYKAPSWFIDYGYLYGWNPDIDFSVVTDPVTHVGTVQYISSDFTGNNYASTMRYTTKIIGIGV